MKDPAGLPGVRPSVLLRLAWRSLATRRVRSLVTVAVLVAAVSAIVGTTGRTEAARRSILAGMESPAARLVRVTDRDGQAQLSPDSVSRLGAVSSVSWVIGLSPAGPLGQNPSLGGEREGYARDAVGTRRFWGRLEEGPLVTLTAGRTPGPSEAVVGERAARSLGLSERLGTVDDELAGPVPIVGSISSAAPIENLESYALVNGSGSTGRISELLILISSSAEVEPLVERLPSLLQVGTPVAIQYADELLALRTGLVKEIGQLDAAILLGGLASSSLLVGAMEYGAVEGRRREFGLRRSQGATRSTIGALVVLETALLAVVGGVLGGVVGGLGVLAMTGTLVDPVLAGAIVLLVVLAALGGAAVPSISAAIAEPLYVLRSE